MNLARKTLPYTKLYLDGITPIIHVELDGFVPSALYRKTVISVLQFIKSRKITAGIYDVRNLKKLPLADQDWFIEEALPLLEQCTLRKVAVIEPIHGDGHLDLNRMVYSKQPSFPFVVQYFADVASSLEWITNASPVQKKQVLYA